MKFQEILIGNFISIMVYNITKLIKKFTIKLVKSTAGKYLSK